jgi:hypothetical protein
MLLRSKPFVGRVLASKWFAGSKFVEQGPMAGSRWGRLGTQIGLMGRASIELTSRAPFEGNSLVGPMSQLQKEE